MSRIESLWAGLPEVTDLPSPGAILSAMTKGTVGGTAYDEAWPARAARTLW